VIDLVRVPVEGLERFDVAALPGRARAGGLRLLDRFNEGLALARRRDWRAAEAAYRDALRARPTLAEAWNGLGYALRNQGKYEDSVRAYHEALRLRPAYPEALEYLGEAYVQMGRLEEARRLLDRLRELNAPEAEDLARAIAGAGPPRGTTR